MEKVIENCCICGSKTEIIYEIPFRGLIGLDEYYTEKVSICNKCGYIFNAAPFSEEQLSNRYKTLSKYEFSVEQNIFEENSAYARRSQKQFNFINENVKNISSIFEVGAASGYNLSIYKNLGAEVFGIEPSSANKVMAKKNYDLELYNDTFQSYIRSEMVCKKKYELIFLSHVLEHIVNPFQFMKEIIEFSDSYIFIEVPTFDYKFMDEPFGMFCEEHVNYFTYESLSYLMESLHYSLVDAQLSFSLDSYFPSGSPGLMTLWKKDTAPFIRKKNRRMPMFQSKELLEEYIKKSRLLENQVDSVINSIDDRLKLAIWGTGHHTSRLLTKPELLSKNIVKFYDSDIRKHEYTMLNKKICSFSKDDITNGEVDVILISSFVAQDAIMKSIEGLVEKERIITFYNK